MKRVFLLIAVAIMTFGLSITVKAKEKTTKTQASSKSNGTAKSDAQTEPVTTQIATTEDGRKALLKGDGTWQYVNHDIAAPKPHIIENCSLAFETGIVFQNGNTIPAARTEFFLLDKSLASILMDIGYTYSSGLKITDINRLYFTFLLHGKRNPPSEEYNKTLTVIEKHVIQTITTDFGGKATFKKLPAGKYWLVGSSIIRGNSVIWDIETNVSAGDNTLILDQNNAGEIYQF